MSVMHELKADQASRLWAHSRNAECDTANNGIETRKAFYWNLLPELNLVHV